MPIDITANYIRIRVASPSGFIRFRIKTLGHGIKAVIGFRKAGGSTIQSLLFPRGSYTLATAKAWVSKHGYTVHESFWVNDISIDPKTNELILEETVAIDCDEPLPMNIKKIKKETWEWLFQ